MVMKTKVRDTSKRDLQRVLRQADALPGKILAEAEKSVAEEKSTKSYKNRTWNLVDTTEARLDASSPELIVVTMEMPMHYASYITDGTYYFGGPGTKPRLSDCRKIGDELGTKIDLIVRGAFDSSALDVGVLTVTI